MRKVLPTTCAKRPVVGAPHSKAQIAIRPAEYFICVVVILPVVFPEANSANFVATTFAKSLKATAGAPKR